MKPVPPLTSIVGSASGILDNERVLPREHMLELVKDIREDVLPVMFEGSLKSGEGEEYDSGRNMGIGLSVCMSIVKTHKGYMTAENRTAGGARVAFWLPMDEDRDDGY